MCLFNWCSIRQGFESSRHARLAYDARVCRRGVCCRVQGGDSDGKRPHECSAAGLSRESFIRPGVKSRLILYECSRNKIEALDFSHFLALLNPDVIPVGQPLHQMMNSLVLSIDGFNHDRRELYLIPHVRRFYAEFHRDWPYSLFFASLDHDWLRILAFCCLREITSITFDGRFKCGVEIDRVELACWVGAAFGPMNSMCERAQMTERAIYDRSKALFEYFDLPFDAPPPE
jgi:hypothetical protein